jgi:cysteine sulfinate desulfinase/cysteine desulfurase-like protein
MKAYLDNGTTTPVAKEMVEAMLPYFTEQFGHPIFLYSLGQEAADAVERAQATIAKTVNAKPFVLSIGTLLILSTFTDSASMTWLLLATQKLKLQQKNYRR